MTYPREKGSGRLYILPQYVVNLMQLIRHNESHVSALFATLVETLSIFGDFSTSVYVSGRYAL